MKWCPFCKLILTSVPDAPGISTCCGCGGAWFATPVTADGVAAALVAVSPRQSTAPHAASYAGLTQACPVCPGATLVAGSGADLQCAKCGGTWLDYARVLVLAPDGAVEAQPTASSTPITEEPAREPLLPALEAQQAGAELQPANAAPQPPQPAASAPPPAFRYPDPPVDPTIRSEPERALAWLLEGNARYVAGACLAPRRTPQTRSHAATGQKPVAVVVTCSDSRVPPELLFDVGIGDIFVVRSAGHIVDRAGIESIHYATEHLGVRLVVVLGHSACGAVRAALAPGGPGPGFDALTRALRRAIDWAASEGAPDEPRTIRLHTLVTAALIERHVPRLTEPLTQPGYAVATAVYDIVTGLVELVPHEEPPAPSPSEPGPGASGSKDPHSRLDGSTRTPPRKGRGGRGASPSSQDLELGVASGAERWCAQCMVPHAGDLEFCTKCGRALVEPWFRIACPTCRKENLIGTPRCWQCSADLHAAPTTPAPPDLRRDRTRKQGEASCTGVIAGLAAVAAAIKVLLAGQ